MKYLVLLVSLCVFGKVISRNILVPWTIAGVETLNSPLQTYQDDILHFQCAVGSFSNAFFITDETQYNNCDGGSHGDEAPVKISFCSGKAENFTVRIAANTMPLAGSTLQFQPDQSYYFASFSNGTDLANAISDIVMGGDCLRGQKFAINVKNGSAPTNNPGTGGGSGSSGSGSTGGLSDALGQTEIIVIAVVCSVATVSFLIICLIVVCCCCCSSKNVSVDIEAKGKIAHQNGDSVELKKSKDKPNQQNNKSKNNADKNSEKPKTIMPIKNGTQEKNVKNSNGTRSDSSRPSSTSKQITERRPSANKSSEPSGGSRRPAPIKQPPPKTGVEVHSSTNSTKPSGRTNGLAPSKPSNGQTKKQPNANGQQAKTNSVPPLGSKGRKDCAVTSSVPASISQNKKAGTVNLHSDRVSYRN